MMWGSPQPRTAVRYAGIAIVVAGVGAAVIGIAGYGVAALTTLILVVVGIVLLLLLERAARSRQPSIEKAGIGLVWSVFVFFVAFLSFTVTAFAVGWPVFWVAFLDIDPDVSVGQSPDTVAADFLGSPDAAALDNDLSQQLIRAFKRDVLDLVGSPFPTTGNVHSTNALTIPEVRVAFAQKGRSLVKVQTFVVPPGAQQLFAPSHSILDNGKPFEATKWAFVALDQQLDELTSVPIGGRSYWRLAEHIGKRLFILALYDNTHVVEYGNRGYAGIEVTDLAGQLGKLIVSIGGEIKDFTFKNAYYGPARQPPKLIPVPSSDVATGSRPLPDVREAFSPLFAHIKQNSARAAGLSSALTVWESGVAENSLWKDIQLYKVKHDVILTFVGHP